MADDNRAPSGNLSRRKLVLGLIIGLTFAYLAVKDVHLEAVWGEVSGLPIHTWIIVAALFLVQQFLRAWRQQLMVQAIKPDSSYRSNLSILCISFFCINSFPLRLGELVRPYLLQDKQGFQLGAGFGVVALERLLDLASALAVLFAVITLLELPTTEIVVAGVEFDVAAASRSLAQVALAPLLLLLFSLVLFPVGAVKILGALMGRVRRLMPIGPIIKLTGIVERFSGAFAKGLSAARDLKRLAAIVTLTVVTWAGSGFMYVALAEGFGIEGVSWQVGMGILVITMLGTALPSPPGFAGVYEFAVVSALLLFGVVVDQPNLALAFALVIHWWIWAIQSTTALYFFVSDGVSWKETASYTRRSTKA
jgi:glycosyltransferase 2 family protein